MRITGFTQILIVASIALAGLSYKLTTDLLVKNHPNDTPAALQPAPKFSVYFVGDAGRLHPRAGLLLEEVLSSQTAARKVIFLGDNIYPSGLRSPQHPEHKRDLQKLQEQLQIVTKTNSEAIFTPGNHDWGKYKLKDFSREHLQRILDQQKVVTSTLEDRESFLPRSGCAGPERITFESTAIIALDTQWLLYESTEKGRWSPDCLQDEEQIYGRLRSFPHNEDTTIFVSHHPLESDGRHGQGGGKQCSQGLDCGRYLQMRRSIKEALRSHSPLICAGGHDHSLQVIRGSDEGCAFYLVSGAMSNVTDLEKSPRQLYGRSTLGFMRVDFPRDAAPILKVFTVEKGAVTPDFELVLKLG